VKRKRPRVAFYTLGCKVNQSETEAMGALFKERGYNIVDFADPADVYVINTCTVTHLADRKSRQVIRRCRKNNPGAKVVVAGCYSQVSPQEVERIPGVNLVVGTLEKNRIVEWLEEMGEDAGQPVLKVRDLCEARDFEDLEIDRVIGRTRAYLKIQDGCEQYCSYCIIPYARGPGRSRPKPGVLREARRLIAAGFKEIVLTGIHLGAYGRDLDAGASLEDLLPELLALSGDVRWRLSSLEPTEVSGALLEIMASFPNICPHLHLPLQSAHDEILKTMNRPYSTGEYRKVIERVRTVLPDIAVTTDIMVGFPGETDEHFKVYPGFIEEMAFSRLHVFKFSPRRGTPAALFEGQVPASVSEERSRQMIRLGERLARRYAGRFVGRTLRVLAETEKGEGCWEGHSENYLLIEFASAKTQRGDIVSVRLERANGDKCRGSGP
jgi:threonylcarbamoyladenosine tRNA methylthiotransferase MtaB